MATATPTSNRVNRKLRNCDVRSLMTAINSLDGRHKAHEVDGKTVIIVEPYALSATCRMAMARNLGILSSIHDAIARAHRAFFAQHADPATQEIPGDKVDEVNRDWSAVMQQEQEITLYTVPESALGVEENQIPVSTLALLSPLLDSYEPPGDIVIGKGVPGD